jgi:hypothetical protein
MNTEGRRNQQHERRILLSQIFIVLLVSIAYQEMVAPIRDSLHSFGITLGATALFLVFLMATMRIFIGSQLHLMSENLLGMPGKVWFYDFLVIILEAMIMIFLGGETSVEVSRNSKIGFWGFLTALYILDVLWIVSQWGIGKFARSWERRFIPWAWAALNIVLIILMVLMRLLAGDIYSNANLIWLVFINAIAFVVDMFLVDYYKIL